MYAIRVSFTPTDDEWQETFRACLLDQRINRMCVAFVILLFVAVAAVLCFWLLPDSDGSWGLWIATAAAVGCIFWNILRLFRRNSLVSELNAFKPDSPEKPASDAGSVFDLPRALSFTEKSIDYRAGETSAVLGWSGICYSETKNLFVLYFTGAAFKSAPSRLRLVIPMFVLMSSAKVQVIPVPKRSFECIPDKNNLRHLLHDCARSA